MNDSLMNRHEGCNRKASCGKRTLKDSHVSFLLNFFSFSLMLCFKMWVSCYIHILLCKMYECNVLKLQVLCSVYQSVINANLSQILSTVYDIDLLFYL